MPEEIVDTAVGIVQKVGFKDRTFNILKKILIILTIFLMLFKFAKWWLNNVRLAWQLQLGDNTWGTIIWIRIWHFVFGLTFGLVAAYLWNADIVIWEWLQETWILIIDVLA